ncbi:MAG: nucleoside hydrolase, partial [Candidatus Hodarchaeales archaeon]
MVVKTKIFFSINSALIVGFLIISVSHVVGQTSTLQEEIPVIIDTDVAPDDIGAILYLLKHPRISVRAITVSCGITYIDAGVNNVLQLLDYLEIHNIPVAGGKTTPLNTNHAFPPLWREGSENFFGLNLPQTNLQPSVMNASELIVSIINTSIENTTIITLGPLTNIATAFQSDPTIKDKIELIDIMGGAIDVAGNVGFEYPEIPNFVAEWNMYIDPHAADIVFKSGVPIMLIPLDATNKVPVTEDFRTNLGNVMQTPEANIVHQLLTP